MALSLHPVSPAGDLLLRAALQQADQFSQAGFTEILVNARVALQSLRAAGAPSPVAAEALQAICFLADETMNDINATAEEFGCDYTEEATHV